MSRHELLNNVTHKNVRIITDRSARYGDDMMASLTFPAEFRNIQAHYPIVFSRSPEGVFNPLALFGFRDKQNLFLGPDGWDVPYIPMMVDRIPFYIGTGANDQRVINIDMDHPRVSQAEGEALFLEHGGTSPFLDRVNGVLSIIHDNLAASQHFIAALVEHNLLESFVLDIKFRDGAEHRFGGFFTV